ncbi:5'-nucleotidase isoform X2 [Ascaphus truei]|uniref:5'-nucleotidase isoform X2 n=1 Tax=Ascaphus truei TaxID=8439 RepID=UPI003F5A055A
MELQLLLLFLLCSQPCSLAASFQLTLLHTNDVHARVEQTSKDSGKCGNPQDCYAGVARRYTKIQEIRKSHENVLLLDAGDQFQGTIWFNYFKGREAAYFMNYLHYDAMALGNHEFDNGVNGLLDPFLMEVKCPILSANIRSDKQLAPNITGYYLPYRILLVGAEKVGIIGYTSKETPVLSAPGPHLLFEDEITALQPQVDKLLTLGVNKIIALGHSGFETDKLIAQKVKGVDVVIGGHTNTFLYTGPPPSNDVPVGQYPFMVTSDDGRSVPVVQAYAFGKYLGYLNVTFDEQGNVLHSSGNPILLNSSIPEDTLLLKEVNKWKEQISNFSTQELGRTLVFLNGSSLECRFRECNMGNLICDAMIYNNIRYPDEMRWNHVSICLINGGGVRASIDERTSNGIRVVFNIANKPGERVVKLEVLCTECRVPRYVPVKMDQVYKVVLPSYIATGGDGFAVLKNESLKHDSGDLDLSVVSNYISQMKRVYTAVEGRVRFSDEEACSGSAHSSHGSFALVVFIALILSLQYRL